MSWRTVVLTKNSELSLRLNHLVIRQEDVVTIPLNEIGQLIIENPNIKMTGHILNALSKHKITVILCNSHHMPYAHINLIYGHYHQVKVINEQINWKKSRKKSLWKYIIKNKINQQKLLLCNIFPNESFKIFDNYMANIELNDATNREGHAAKVYFNKLFGLNFNRHADCPINWALDYGYTLILALFTRVITTKGLLTELGVKHKNQYNFYNLASDFMEVYRPLIDKIVYENVKDEFMTREKRKLLNVFDIKVSIRNRNQYLSNSVDIYVDSLIRYMSTGEKNRLAFPSFNFKNQGG